MESTMKVLMALTGRQMDVSFCVGDTEIAAIGDFCVIAAPSEKRSALRDIVGPVVVNDLEQTKSELLEAGAEIIHDRIEAPSGSVLYARNSDGVVVEWLQYSPEILRKVVPAAWHPGE